MPGPDASACLHDWLAATARAMPDRPAVQESDRVLTVAELFLRAQAVGRTLVEAGVGRGDRVAIALDKSGDSITAIFGTLLAGGCYVPIPASWPAQRTEGVLEACAPAAVISLEAGPDPQPVVSSRQGARSIPWERAIAARPLGGEAPACTPEGPALILFTSGSTGAPKGVTISHRAVGSFVAWSVEAFGIGAGDRLVCPSPLGFDLSTLDVFSIAAAGAACVVMPEAAWWIPRLSTRFVRDRRVTLWYSVPSILGRMLDDGAFEREPIRTLRTVLFAGEVMPPSWAARLRAAYPRAALWNLYGPTETNVVTAHRLGASVDANASVPIGRACPYARLRLLQDADEGVDGVRTGELLVGGTSVMAGYWGRPEETARALVHLDDGDGGARVYYRTGDRVAENADGTLSFVGRVDRQVKRRGVRIELGEIEAALAGAPGVAEAAAVAAEREGATAIAAFVAARDGAQVDTMALRAHCARLLPSYMMPDEIQQVPRLPRGSRGKVDYEVLRTLRGRSA